MNSYRILFRTEISDKPNVGTGHFWRSRYLSAEMRRRGHRARIASKGERLSFKALLARFNPHAVVFDCWSHDAAEIKAAKAAGAKTILMDARGKAARIGDRRINALLPDPAAHLTGERYVIIPAFKRLPRKHPRVAQKLVCSFGGKDRHRIMLRFLRRLESRNPFEKVWCFCDAAYRRDAAFKALARRLAPRVQFFYADPRLQQFLQKADMGFLAGGLTLYQALACGLPCVVTGQHAHQTLRAKLYAKRGIVLHAGMKDALPKLRALQADVALRRRLSASGMRLVDGKGLSRVADALERWLGS